MSRQSMFQELARNIPDKERKQLLEKIGRSLSRKITTDDNIHRAELPEEERKALITREIDSMSISGRIALWFRCVSNATTREDGLVLTKLNGIRRKIRRYGAGIVNFDARTFTPKFASLLYPIYERVHPLIPVFRSFWQDGAFFEGMVMHILERKMRAPDKGTTDIVPIQDLKKIYLRTEKKDEIRNEIIRMTNAYVQSIPDGLFKDAEEDLLPLYYFRDLVFFPFHEIFCPFGFTPDERLPDKPPEFRDGTIGLVQEALEKLYYTLYVVQRLPTSSHLPQELFEYRAKNESPGEKNAGMLAKDLRDKLNACRQETSRFLQKVPLPDIIRYFRHDPYYRMMFYLPNPRLKEFYHSALKIKIFSEFDMVFRTIRRTVTEDLIGEIFMDQQVEELRFYTDYQDFPWKRLGLPFFTHVYMMKVLNTYVSKIFRPKARMVLGVIARKITTGKQQLQDLLILKVASIEDLVEKIRAFDYSLAPETDDGKSFVRARYSLTNDMSHARIYETIVTQKDREAGAIIENGSESLDSLNRSISEALTVLRQSDRRKGGQEDESGRLLLEKKLTELAAELTKFRKLMTEIRGLEAHLKIR